MNAAPGTSPAFPPHAGPIDAHVHVVGNGAGGTGCRLRTPGWRRLMVPVILRHVGLPARALDGDLDRLYVERLLQLVRESSLESVVILAHEQVYDARGRVIDRPGT